jgi:hypothetical protein
VSSRQGNQLGTRTLQAQIDSDDSVVFTTYTIVDLRGNGKDNLQGTAKGDSAQTSWFFVYFGYRKTAKKAHGVYWTRSSQADFTQSNIQHITTSKFFI